MPCFWKLTRCENVSQKLHWFAHPQESRALFIICNLLNNKSICTLSVKHQMQACANIDHVLQDVRVIAPLSHSVCPS